MFNMFGKKKQSNYGSKNVEDYAPAILPKNAEEGHTDLSTFITGDYSLLNDTYLEECYSACESKLAPLVQISDAFTVGNTCDAYIDAEMKIVKNKHMEEVAMHELSNTNIIKSRNVRMKELEKRISELQEHIEDLRNQIAPLKDKHARHAIRIGKHIIQLGLPVTIVAFIADFFVNTEFVQSILYSNINMLRILVICLCLMSDGTMFATGSLISQKSESGVSKWLFRTFCMVFLSLFAVSVFGSIAIRVGSMPLTYGSYAADGSFIGKETFTVAEYALAFISSLATAVTGALSLYFSVDTEYYLEKKCRKLETDLVAETALCNTLKAECAALEQAADPRICDRERRKAAEANLEALSIGLKMYVRRLLALHQKDASYADAMSESAQTLLPMTGENIEATAETDVNDAHSSVKTAQFHMDKKIKEVV